MCSDAVNLCLGKTAEVGNACRCWVISEHCAVGERCLLDPELRTLAYEFAPSPARQNTKLVPAIWTRPRPSLASNSSSAWLTPGQTP